MKAITPQLRVQLIRMAELASWLWIAFVFGQLALQLFDVSLSDIFNGRLFNPPCEEPSGGMLSQFGSKYRSCNTNIDFSGFDPSRFLLRLLLPLGLLWTVGPAVLWVVGAAASAERREGSHED